MFYMMYTGRWIELYIMHIPLKVFLNVCGSFSDHFASLVALTSSPG